MDFYARLRTLEVYALRTWQIARLSTFEVYALRASQNQFCSCLRMTHPLWTKTYHAQQARFCVCVNPIFTQLKFRQTFYFCSLRITHTPKIILLFLYA